MTIISETMKIIMKDKHSKEYHKLMKQIEKHKEAGESMDEYFLGKDPRKTKYYKDVMKQRK